MTLNASMVTRAVHEARKKSGNRILVSLSAFTYAFLRTELLEFQKTDGHVEYLINQLIPAGTVEVQNVQEGFRGGPQSVDCREKVARRA